jgi:transposase
MKKRVFTTEFKLELVQAVLQGEKTVMQLCREYSLSDSLIPNWKKLYREKGAAAFTSATHARSAPASVETQELLSLCNKVAELERLIGQQTVELSIQQGLIAAPNRAWVGDVVYLSTKQEAGYLTTLLDGYSGGGGGRGVDPQGGQKSPRPSGARAGVDSPN